MRTRFTLFIHGSDPENADMEQALRRWCDRELPDGYALDVLDVGRWPVTAENFPVQVTPALARDDGTRLVVGDLSDVEAAMELLGIVSLPVASCAS
ncbi:circadian clock KaiB family protein [Solidesulfovibrio sp.]|uniref:circadian clock KaiB family protein n=1 Tax=Solidesulfovibrio sp. TaxID=2910990 RepID=UPI00262DFCC6|nr:circadian clock KaiB family protein [Solidesulfovibrio sp.]